MRYLARPDERVGAPTSPAEGPSMESAAGRVGQAPQALVSPDSCDFPRCHALVPVTPGESPKVLRACRPSARSCDDTVSAEVPAMGSKCVMALEQSGIPAHPPGSPPV